VTLRQVDDVVSEATGWSKKVSPAELSLIG